MGCYRSAIIPAVLAIASLALVGCARTSSLPLSQDVVRISARTAPICGEEGAQRLALQRSAVETIKAGYDKFTIVQARYDENRQVVGYTPVVASTSGTYGYGSYSGSTYVSGGQPIIGGTNDSDLLVKMYSEDDPKGKKALSARGVLGPDWKQKVKSRTLTCLGD